MHLLQAEQRTFAYENGTVIAGLHEHNGYRWYSAFDSRDGQHLARSDDLECLLVNEVDRSARPPKL